MGTACFSFARSLMNGSLFRCIRALSKILTRAVWRYGRITEISTTYEAWAKLYSLQQNSEMIKGYIIADFLSEDNKMTISKAADKYGFELQFFVNGQEAKGRIADAELLYCSDSRMTAYAPSLKWCHTPFAGTEKLLATGVFDSGEVILTNSSGAYGLAISEYIIMAALMLMKQMPEYRKITDERRWLQNLPTRSIAGSNIVIIGTGDVGSNAAKRFRLLGAASVTGFNRSGRDQEYFDNVYRLSEFADHVSDTDVLVMCVPGTLESKGLLSEKFIDALPDKAVIINVGRGTTIDQDALLLALNEGRIAGAMLDVVYPEPLPEDHPLWTAKNCIITPHISGDMSLPHTVDITVDIFCENMRRYVNGEELLHRIDPAKGY